MQVAEIPTNSCLKKVGGRVTCLANKTSGDRHFRTDNSSTMSPRTRLFLFLLHHRYSAGFVFVLTTSGYRQVSAVPHDLRPVFQANRKGKGKGQNGHTSPHMHPNLASDGICNWIILPKSVSLNSSMILSILNYLKFYF